MALNETSLKIHEVGLDETDDKLRFEVRVTSREMIKPPYPTPTENKIVVLSVLDQMAVTEPISVLFFYGKSIDSTEASKLLKKSLSETLAVFYPLAGRVVQNKLIKCNDEGAEFCEAQVSQNLVHYLENPSQKDLHALLPFPLHKNIVLSVQVNEFSCGGFALSVRLSHKIADLAAFFDFLSAWTTNARRANNNNNINNFDGNDDDKTGRSGVVFEGASIFPGIPEFDEVSPFQLDEYYLCNDNVEMRRIVFGKKMIDELKAEVEACGVTRPTRVEVVMAFLWKHFPPSINSIVQMVNLRRKTDPPMPDNFFGNCIWLTRTSSIDVSKKYPELIIAEFRKAIDKLSGNRMVDFIASDNFMAKFNEEIGALFLGEGDYLISNSFSGFRLYDINFGWGDPLWFAPIVKPHKNGLLTVSTKSGGIEAWICMLRDDMSVFISSISHFCS